MKFSSIHTILLFLFFFNLAQSHLLPSSILNSTQRYETYIIHVQKSPAINALSAEEHINYYKSFLPAQSSSSSGEQRFVYSYHNAISGFAAKLTTDELKAIKKLDGVLHAYPDRLISLHTTHVSDFLGLNPKSCFMRDTNFGKGAIIGILDTGILPTHPSFKDTGIAQPPPTKWKGHCEFKPDMCNNKIVGAKSFHHAGGNDLPFDDDGHGTHTASIAAGWLVRNADVLGNARGTASGVAPGAHLAIYKVCHAGGCLASDVLGGIDQAIADGVDVISISLGGAAVPFYDDAVAIGTLAAVEKGIFVSSSAGNAGPGRATVQNDAPWLLTTGAGSTDRAIRATVRLGSGVEIDGESSYQPIGFTSVLLPIAYPGAGGGSRAKTCADGSLSRLNIRGKIVLCHTGGANTSIEKGVIVAKSGGIAMILVNDEKRQSTVAAGTHVLPTAHVGYTEGTRIVEYVASANPTATILFKGTVYGATAAPAVASFSGRGPSTVNEGILKPDIIGPGVNLAAAWPFPVGPPALSAGNMTLPTFNMASGTSAAAAVLAGVATLLKLSHPDWSAAAIKSAMMTTTDVWDHDGGMIVDETLGEADYFAVGSGHVNPTRADDPGLLYDLLPVDYVPYLCGLGYTDKQVSTITRRSVECSVFDAMAAEQLNYPSISVAMGSNAEKTVMRTVSNVGEEEAVYSAQIKPPEGVEVTVYPGKLGFSAIKQNRSFNVYFSTGDVGERRGTVAQGQLTWVSGKHFVRSPLLISFV